MRDVRKLEEPPVVGRYYLVPCVRFAPFDLPEKWMPVFEPYHSDPELSCIGPHYHKDLRFLPTRDRVTDGPEWESPELTRVLRAEDCIGWPVLRKMKCKRQTPVWPSIGRAQDNAQRVFRAFYRSYENRPLLCGRCPHRGVPASAMARTEIDGRRVLVCPGHGLTFDAETGRVIPRFS